MVVVGEELRISCLKKIEASASIYEKQCVCLARLDRILCCRKSCTDRLQTGAIRNHVIMKQRPELRVWRIKISG